MVAAWKHGPHLLTCRQAERTFHLVVTALAKDHPDGAPSPGLASILDALPEASIPPGHKDTTCALRGKSGHPVTRGMVYGAFVVRMEVVDD